MHMKVYARALATVALALPCLAVQAGESAWTQAKTSAGISRGGHDINVAYTPTAGSVPLDARIIRVHATRSYQGAAPVQTRLCWNGVAQCVPITGNSLTTHAFDGLDASKPFYLVHRVPGNTALTPPLFVKGEVAIWFTQ